MDGRAASIGDVAARAGVSVATVSRALRGLPNVAPDTRRRVLEAAEALRYVADPHASRLASGRARTIGLVVPLFTQWYFTQVVAGVEQVLAAAGYDLLLYNVSGPVNRQRFLDELPFRKRVDGIVVIDLALDAAEQDRIAEPDSPVVTVGTRTDRFASVTIDNVAAAVTATRHLANLGHERIGLIGNTAGDPLGFTAPLERREGYRRVLAQLGLELRPDLDVPGGFTLRGGAEAMAHLCATDRPPTAVFVMSDEMAIGALRTLRDAGVRVPHDVSVVGFDDHEMAAYTGLTTVSQPVIRQGEIAATLLLESLTGLHDTETPHLLLPTQLRVRSTTGPRRVARLGDLTTPALTPPTQTLAGPRPA